MPRMTYMRSWKSLRLTWHTWLDLNPQIGRPLSRIVVPLVYFFILRIARKIFYILDCGANFINSYEEELIDCFDILFRATNSLQKAR
jgi:hypothetical protein